MKKKVVCMMLFLSMTVSMTACGNKTTDTGNEAVENTESTTESSTAAVDTTDYDAVSAEIYDNALGDFYAKMAVAEAKLMESAIMVPLNSLGGKYAIGRIAPYTIDYALRGNDYERFHSALVCTDFIKADDRVEMKNKWAELKSTGTYLEWAKSYLEEKGYTLKASYNIPYNADPTTWDCMATYLAADSDAIVNTFDGLMEYDCEGTLQPALAENYTVSDDGLTYTFYLRKVVQWVDSQGRQVAEVTADDFVAGMQHLLDAQAGMEYLTEGIITNASEFISGEITDFSQVGVKAVDDYTYGKDINSIAYCGPYLVTMQQQKIQLFLKQMRATGITTT